WSSGRGELKDPSVFGPCAESPHIRPLGKSCEIRRPQAGESSPERIPRHCSARSSPYHTAWKTCRARHWCGGSGRRADCFGKRCRVLENDPRATSATDDLYERRYPAALWARGYGALQNL